MTIAALLLCGLVAAARAKSSFWLAESIPEQVELTPAHTTFDAWKALVESAQDTIDIGQYYWTLSDGADWPAEYQGSVGPAFLDLLRAAAARGIKIRIIQNKPGDSVSDGKDTQMLADEGVADVRSIDFSKLDGYMSSGIFHNKMIIVDGKHTYIGSANSDWRSLTQVKEMGAVVWENEPLGADVTAAFEAFWTVAEKGAIPDRWPKKAKSNISIDNPLSIKFEEFDGKAKVYVPLAPPDFCVKDRTTAEDATVSAIKNAQEFVDIEVMDYIPAALYIKPKFFWPVLDDAMRDAAFRGVRVRLLVSLWNHTKDSAVPYLKSLNALSPNLEVRWFLVPDMVGSAGQVPFTRVNHAKFLATETQCIIANWNWSADYFLSTGGVALAVTHKDVAAELDKVFERDWTSKYTHPLDSMGPTHH